MAVGGRSQAPPHGSGLFIDASGLFIDASGLFIDASQASRALFGT